MVRKSNRWYNGINCWRFPCPFYSKGHESNCKIIDSKNGKLSILFCNQMRLEPFYKSILT